MAARPSTLQNNVDFRFPQVPQPMGNNVPLFASTPKDAFAAAAAASSKSQIQRNAAAAAAEKDVSFNALMNPSKM